MIEVRYWYEYQSGGLERRICKGVYLFGFIPLFILRTAWEKSDGKSIWTKAEEARRVR